MTEFSRSQNHLYSQLEAGLLSLVTGHWMEYNSAAPEDRLGDEEQWDTVLYGALRELSIDAAKAQEICELGKLQAELQRNSSVKHNN